MDLNFKGDSDNTLFGMCWRMVLMAVTKTVKGNFHRLILGGTVRMKLSAASEKHVTKLRWGWKRGSESIKSGEVPPLVDETVWKSTVACGHELLPQAEAKLSFSSMYRSGIKLPALTIFLQIFLERLCSLSGVWSSKRSPPEMHLTMNNFRGMDVGCMILDFEKVSRVGLKVNTKKS